MDNRARIHNYCGRFTDSSGFRLVMVRDENGKELMSDTRPAKDDNLEELIAYGKEIQGVSTSETS